MIFEGDITEIKELPNFSIIRATETWQQAGACYVRIQTMAVSECEVWAEELGCSRTVVESRENKVEFYEQMLYEKCGEVEDGETFRCIRMEKDL